MYTERQPSWNKMVTVCEELSPESQQFVSTDFSDKSFNFKN